jgi:AraC-like DNA-binding protein
MKAFFLGGIIQALLLAFYFLFNKSSKNVVAQRWLGILLLLIATTMALNYFLPDNYKQFPHLIRVWELLPLLYAPTIFLYIYALLYGNIHYSKKYFLLLVPFILGILILFPFLTSSSVVKIQQYELTENRIPENFYLLFWLKSINGLVMILASFYAVFKYKKDVKLVFADNAVNKWGIYSLIAFLLLWIVGTGRILFGFSEMISKMVFMILIISIYVLTYFTLKQTQVFRETDLQVLEEIETKINKPKLSLIEKEEAKSIYSNLSNIVKEEKLFLDKNFNLQKLTQICNCKSSVVSNVLNNHNNQNFYGFINEFRVNEVCEMLKNNENAHLTLDAIGELCGFKSKSTFYQSFKEVTGKTPMQYKKELNK